MKNYLKKLYRDKLTLYRYEDVLVNGFDKQKEVLVCSDVSCKVSKGRTIVEDGIPKIKGKHKLFISDVSVFEGDILLVTMFDNSVVEYVAGEVFPYSNHIEVELKRNDTV